MPKTEEQLLETARKIYKHGKGFNPNWTFEEFFERFKKTPEVLWHHGTCDCCGERLVLVCHFGYKNFGLPGWAYQICEKCLKEQAHLIYSEK